MHVSMYDHPAVIENIEKLRKMGVEFVEPKLEEAKAKIPDVKTIVDSVIGRLGPRDLLNKSFVLTAGPTRGWIDRVRFITNPSSGKMGIAIAGELLNRGASVSLILGPVSETPPTGAKITRVETTQEMLEVTLLEIAESKPAALISSAAVLDYVPSERDDRKRPSGEAFSIDLVPTPKIIDAVRAEHKDLIIVGFKVESGVTDEELEKRARQKIQSGICNLVVANDAQRKGVAFGTDTNEVIIVGENGYSVKLPLASKRDIAKGIVDAIVQRI